MNPAFDSREPDWRVRPARTASDAVRIATWGLLPALLREVGELWDWGWHRSPEQQAAFLGFPHPWNFPHLLFATGILGLFAVLGLGHPRLFQWIRSGFRGSASIALRDSPGTTVAVAGVLLFLVASVLDTRRHLQGGPDPAFTFQHVMLTASSAVACLGMFLIATLDVPAGRARRILSWAWLVALLSTTMTPFPPLGLQAWSANAQAAIGLVKLVLPVALALRFGPWPLRVTGVVGAYVFIRLLAWLVESAAGFSVPPPVLQGYLVPAVLSDGALLLLGTWRGAPFVAALVFGLAAGPAGYLSLMVRPETWSLHGLRVASAEGAAGAAALVVLLLAIDGIRRRFTRVAVSPNPRANGVARFWPGAPAAGDEHSAPGSRHRSH